LVVGSDNGPRKLNAERRIPNYQLPNINAEGVRDFFLQLFLAGKVTPTTRLMFSGLPSPRK
jgi:hypothetical protein